MIHNYQLYITHIVVVFIKPANCTIYLVNVDSLLFQLLSVSSMLWSLVAITRERTRDVAKKRHFITKVSYKNFFLLA